MSFPTVIWGETRATFLRKGEILPQAPITAALVFALREGEFVLADIEGRGWCIPGGRLEPGESVEQAARREAWEEIGATLGPLTLLGHYVLAPRELDTRELDTRGDVETEAEANSNENSLLPARLQPLSAGQRVTIPHTRTPDSRLRLAVAYLALVTELAAARPPSESKGVCQVRYADLPTRYYAWDPLLEAMFDYVWRVGRELLEREEIGRE